MSDPKDDLRAKLALLQEKLAAADSLDPEVRTLLEGVLRDVDRVATGTDSDATLATRLGEAARQFEDDHPTLSGSIGSVIDALSRMGI